MGNEMGNNNTSGLQEEDNTIVEDQGKSAQEPVHDIDVKAQDHVVPLGASKEHREKGAGLAADVPKGETDDQTSDGKEMLSNEAGGEDTEIQPTSLSNELESLEKQKDSNLEENLLKTTHQFEKPTPMKKEEEDLLISTSVRISASHDPEPQESVGSKFDQQGVTKAHADQSLQHSTYSVRGTGNTQVSSVTWSSKENGHQGHEFETNMANRLDHAVVSETNLDVENKRDDLLVKELTSQEHKMPGEKNFKTEKNGGNGLSTKASSDFLSDVGQKYDGELTSEMSCYENSTLELQPEAYLMANPLNSHWEASLPEDKIMVLTEGNELQKKESGSEDGKHDCTPTECRKDSIVEVIDEANESQTDPCFGPHFLNNENENSVCISHDPANSGNCQFESKIDEHCHSIDFCNDNKSEADKEHSIESEEETKVVLELRVLPATMLDGKSKGEEPGDCKHGEEEPAEKRMAIEIEEKTEAFCASGKGAEEKESGELVMFQSLPVQEEAYKSANPASLSQSLDQQNIAVESEDAHGSSEPNLQLKPENYGEFFLTAASTFYATNLKQEALVSPVELAFPKYPQEASHYVKAAAEMVTETKASASAHQNCEQYEEGETSFFASGGYEGQGSIGRLSTESIPNEMNIQVQIPKSPSFDFGLQVEAGSEESDRTPLLYQDKTTIESVSNQADLTRQNPPLRDQYHEEALHFEATPVEEKVITLERCDSEKSRTPFLGFPKEDEEAHFVVIPKEQGNHASSKKATKDLWNSPSKEAASTIPKGTDKPKRRTSIFGNCMCCATVIN